MFNARFDPCLPPTSMPAIISLVLPRSNPMWLLPSRRERAHRTQLNDNGRLCESYRVRPRSTEVLGRLDWLPSPSKFSSKAQVSPRSHKTPLRRPSADRETSGRQDPYLPVGPALITRQGTEPSTGSPSCEHCQIGLHLLPLRLLPSDRETRFLERQRPTLGTAKQLPSVPSNGETGHLLSSRNAV